MSPVIATFFCFALYFLGYRFYARYLGRRLFDLDPARQTPAHAMRDEVDYV
ncbi:MAG: carbon starvation protein CstA domain protein, partial [Acidobacteria bacterium]|nr:carbon starvation protein CstA domain protein [Acidobacteriota bacterium]